MSYIFSDLTKGSRRRPLNGSRLIALIFIGIILIGTALLMLPFASRDGQCCGLIKALFTATSSTCVTGLILADTWTQWSGFGQVVIICMIEVGGLGFMSVASMMIFLLRRKMNMNTRLLVAQTIGAEDMADAMRVQKRMLIGCLSVEAIGAAILALRFLSEFDWLTALKLGGFHAISAFCNAGFDILGFQAPGQSLIPYATDPVIILTISALIIIGGVGFLVWDEIFRVHSPKRWSVYTKLVVITSIGLLLLGTIGICSAEWHNPATLGNMNSGEKILAGFFQSVTTRTAGFAGIDQGAMTEGAKGISIFLMLIGGSSGSTAGGLKTVTFVVLILFLWTRIRGKETVHVFHRMIPNRHVLNALTLFGIMILLALFGACLICWCTPMAGLTDGLYESVSALATVGVTTGITPNLGIPAKLLMILYMYFGRVGILTLSLGFLGGSQKKEKYKYAETELLIG